MVTVVQFPQLSEIDKQFLILEQQQSEIQNQSRLIKERGLNMPNVGGKKFGYDKKGMAAASKEAKKTGKPMKKKAGYSKGGMAVKKKK
tara:strand:+ start:120 stop:383 length:264 start_codon:yes stop_codon:yes gene_type:complete